MATMNSIIFPHYKDGWKKLLEPDPLVQLHRKFWVQGEYDKLLIAGEDEGATGFVEGAAEDDDDVGPECYILDSGIPDERSKLWVRREYIRMYKRCVDHFKIDPRELCQSPSLVVTGQPGIGKRYWLLYVLCRRLACKKPIMWYRGKKLHLFVEGGVFISTKDYPSTSFRTRVWTVVDADEGERVPEALAVQDSKHMIIFTSSPNSARWKGLTKTAVCATAIMNPWTRREISETAAIHGFSGNDRVIDEMYNRFGPTPRICFDYLKRPPLLYAHKESFRLALSNLSLRSFQKIVHYTSFLRMDDVSRTILLIKRQGSDLSRARYTLEPATPAIETVLRDQFRTEARADRLNFYRSLAKDDWPWASRVVGVVYESLVQETLQQLNTIELHLVPMMMKTRPDGSGQGKKFPRWYSNHGDGADTSSAISINIRQTDVFSSKPNPIKDKVYYTLHHPNQVAVDSFILDNDRLFIFRFTVAADHDINKGILTFFSQASLPPRANWYFVFVVPPVLSELSCPQPRDPELKAFLEEVHLCSIVVDPQP